MKKVSAIYALLFLPLVTAVFTHIIDFGGIEFSSMGSVVLSYLIYFSFSDLIYAAFQKVWIAWLSASLPGITLSVISHYKLMINRIPFTVRDFKFGNDIGEIMGFAMPQINWWYAVIVAVLLGGLIALFVFLEKYYIKSQKMRYWFLGAGAIIIVTLCLQPVGEGVSFLLGTKDRASDEITMKSGVISGLYLGVIEGRRSYNSTQGRVVDGIPSEDEQEKESVKPTVIFLMSESFFDVDRLEGVEYSEDPIPNFHKLEKTYSSGSFISNTFCGGTGYVEMEFLTGLCNEYLKSWHDLTTLPEDAYNTMPCITDVFENHGYETTFLHSYNDELYNRPVIYKSLGFDKVLFDDSFPEDAEKRGGYISDASLAKKIISEYENRQKDNLMLFAISMENHQPYNENKFSQTDIEVSSSKLTQEGKTVLQSYIHGAQGADEALGILTEYFAKKKEPVVIVFWGDHLPSLNLSDGGSVYKELGFVGDGSVGNWSTDELMSILRTDYVIWDNYGLKKKDRTIGSSMFALDVMQRINLGLTDYYLWIKENVKDNYLMYRSGLFAVSDKEYYSKIPKKHEEMMLDYAAVVSNIAYENNTLFKQYRVNKKTD